MDTNTNTNTNTNKNKNTNTNDIRIEMFGQIWILFDFLPLIEYKYK